MCRDIHAPQLGSTQFEWETPQWRGNQWTFAVIFSSKNKIKDREDLVIYFIFLILLFSLLRISEHNLIFRRTLRWLIIFTNYRYDIVHVWRISKYVNYISSISDYISYII